MSVTIAPKEIEPVAGDIYLMRPATPHADFVHRPWLAFLGVRGAML